MSTTTTTFTAPQVTGHDGRSLKAFVITSEHEDGTQRRVNLLVSHDRGRKHYRAYLSRCTWAPREFGFSSEQYDLHNDMRLLGTMPTARYSEKGLRAAFETFLLHAEAAVALGWK